jgi:hypothetical protein
MPAIPGMRDAFCVTTVRPPRDLVLTVPEASGGIQVSWELLLQPLDYGRTRLIMRGRISRHWPGSIRERSRPPGRLIFIERIYAILAYTPRPLMLVAAAFGHCVMQARMLRGIKRRAEAWRQVADRAGGFNGAGRAALASAQSLRLIAIWRRQRSSPRHSTIPARRSAFKRRTWLSTKASASAPLGRCTSPKSIS